MPLDCPPDTASCSHVHGMTPISGTMSGPPTVSTTLSCNTPGTTSSLSKDNLLLELELERSRRIALELENDTLTKTVQAWSVSSVQSTAEYQHIILSSEIDSAVGSRAMLLHGPDTVEHFAEFSMTTIITELQNTCPQVYELVQQLGRTQRNARGNTLPGEELKSVMALCTLLNARSARIKVCS